MKRLLIMGVLLALSIGACVWQWDYVPTPPTTFEQACEVLERDELALCDNVSPPEVITTILLPWLAEGIHGVTIYEEERIYLASRGEFDPDDVLFHEMIHWILRKGNDIPPDRCTSEEIARKYSTSERGLPGGDEWRMGYGCLRSPIVEIRWIGL